MTATDYVIQILVFGMIFSFVIIGINAFVKLEEVSNNNPVDVNSDIEENFVPVYEPRYIQKYDEIKTTDNLQWTSMPIKYSIIEIDSGNGGVYACPENEKVRIRKAMANLTEETDNIISFQEVNESEAKMKFQCLGRKPLNQFYEEVGNVQYTQDDALITIRNANDPYRNCLDVELHEILHTFGYDDIIYNDNNVNNVMVTKDARQCANLPDLSKIKEDYR